MIAMRGFKRAPLPPGETRSKFRFLKMSIPGAMGEKPLLVLSLEFIS